jgi:diphthamide biosynthesis protein 7
MHSGARVVEIVCSSESEAWSVKVIGKFEGHKSMNYGSDFVPGSQASEQLDVVSTSFYDKLVCFWQIQLVG